MTAHQEDELSYEPGVLVRRQQREYPQVGHTYLDTWTIRQHGLQDNTRQVTRQHKAGKKCGLLCISSLSPFHYD